MTHNLPHGKNLGSTNPNMVGYTSSVVTNHWLASMVGRDILNKGGNAFDAACAVSFMLGVVEPQMSGIGGDGFIMMFDKSNEKVSFHLNPFGSFHPISGPIDPSEKAIDRF